MKALTRLRHAAILSPPFPGALHPHEPEETVRRLAVSAQGLAMIRGEDDQRGLQQFRLFEKLPEPAQLVGDVVDFPRVGLGLGRRRSVGQVRVVETNPGEERTLRAFGDPGTSAPQRFLGPTLGQPLQIVVVHFEALLQSQTLAQDQRTEEGAGSITLLP